MRTAHGSGTASLGLLTRLVWLGAAVGCLLPAIALAQTAGPASAQSIADARDLATTGMQQQADRKYAECSGTFKAAHDLYPEAATVTIRWAQCLAGAGRLIEASEAYRTLLTTPLPANAPPQFKQAQAQGKAESEELEKRIPKITITVDPTPPPSGTQLHMQHANGTGAPTVDVLDAAWIGTARRVNPGTYTVFATAPGYASKTKQVALAEGESKREALLLSAGEEAPVVAGTQTKVAGPGEAPPPYVAPPEAVATGTASRNGLILGIGAAGYGASGSDDISGGSGLVHAHVWLRLTRFLLGGVLEYQGLPTGSRFDSDGSKKLINSYYGGLHAGFLSTANRKVALWLDGGFGIQGAQGSTSLGGQFAIGPSFPLSRTIRLVTKAFAGFNGTPGNVMGGLAVDLEFEIPFGKPAGAAK